MKFAVLKALTSPGVLSATWKNAIQGAYRGSPDIVRKDYEKLIRVIADLELIEKHLREEVLSLDEETSNLRTAVDRAVRMGALLAPVLTLYDRLQHEDMAKLLSDVENIVARIPGIGRSATLSGRTTGLERFVAASITAAAENRRSRGALPNQQGSLYFE